MTILALIVAIWLLPSAVAVARCRHLSRATLLAIVAADVLGSWTVVGWWLALWLAATGGKP